MKVPVRNIFFLLAYAWSYWREGKELAASSERGENMQELLARVLSNGLARLMKKGLKRQHITREEVMSGIKGKMEMTRSVQGMLFQQGKAACRYDEISVDILPNRILKATIRQLLSTEGIDKGLKTELRGVYRLMGGISLVDLRKKDFEEALRQRNDRLYGILLQICRFVHEQTMVDERTGERVFQDLLREEDKMAGLFEEFVRNFYEAHLNGATVKKERLAWDLDEGSSSELLPGMETDISIIGSDSYWIIDTKYYKEALSTNPYEQQRIKTANLYQLFAYLKNAPHRTSRPPQGMLLYPTVDQELDERFSIQGHPIRVATVDLGKEWGAIEERLLGLGK